MSRKEYESDGNSSPDSTPNLSLWRTNAVTKFYVKRRKIYGHTFSGKQRKITKLSHLALSATNGAALTGLLTDSTSQRGKHAECAREWTQFFLENDIKLVGGFSCANKLKDASSSEPIELEADCLFLYYSLTPRRVQGKDKGVMAHEIRRVHLEDTKQTLTLDPFCLYALGDSNLEPPSTLHTCILCTPYNRRHIIDNCFTPCGKVHRFVTTDPTLLRMTKHASQYGAVILHVPTNRESNLRTCVYGEFLCDHCRARAISEGNQWFRMTGDCPQEKDICPNHEACECVEEEEENEEHTDYFFIPECSVNNLPNNPVADGLTSGKLKFVWGAEELSGMGHDYANLIKQNAMKRMKAGELVTIPQLIEECGGLTCDEFLAVAMSDKRLADFIDGNKSFTLSKVNGFIENPDMHKTGPWLDGRLVTDSDNVVWQLPHMRKVVVETREDISCIHIARSGDKKCDALGSFIR